MEKFPFIQVGVGNRGAQILNDLLGGYADRFEPLALVDVVEDYLIQARGTHRLPGIAAYGELSEALAAQPEAEVVVVVTPARYHAALVREALEAGKHVWVEKPLTYSYSEAQELADLARRRGKAVVIGNQYQYGLLERQLQRLVQSGDYGDPYLLTYTHHRHRPVMRAFTGEYPALWEQGVHSLDSILAILGHPDLRSVYALGLKPPHSNYNSDTMTNVLTEFGNGVQAHLLVTFDSQNTDWTVRVECTEAALQLVPSRGAIEVLSEGGEPQTFGPAEDIDPDIRDPYMALYTSMTTGRTTPTAIEVNLKTIQWIDAAVRSLDTGSVVAI